MAAAPDGRFVVAWEDDGDGHSNLATAAGIVVYEALRQTGFAGME